MPKALSATVPEPLEARARAIAKLENRSLSNVVENALGVFTAMPKDLRDHLVERLSIGGPEDSELREVNRQIMFAMARLRFEAARDAIAKQIKASNDPTFQNVDDWELIPEPTGP
jgi:hypothetical protein